MSRGDGSYDGEFMEDYTDYDISCHNGDSVMSNIDYYSSMEGMGRQLRLHGQGGHGTLHRRLLRL
jgi:hypothetical protein